MHADTAPRYTSYPTAPHFHQGIDAAVVEGWIAAIPQGERLSLYIHVPFCDRLCWFCACHTKQTKHYKPVASFLERLHEEIPMVGAMVGDKGQIASLHFGGGSPTLVAPDDMRILMAALRRHFTFLPDASISVEIDPNDMDEGRLDAFADIGMTRASLGIQDFDEKVQKAINREQSFEDTKAVIDGLRAKQIASVNLDILYGLPHQSVASVTATVEKVLSLRPERIALFGYAHVPWFKKHQTMIDEAVLPGPDERLAQSLAAAEMIASAGYETIGLDHFALPGDSLAIAAKTGKLKRNFQGYTDDGAHTLIGLGPSSISRYRQGYAQNITATGEYQRRIGEGRLATERGVAFSDDDRLRAWVIERLMCDFAFCGKEAKALFGQAAMPVLAQAARMTGETPQSLRSEDDRFVVPEDQRPLVRLVAARFDAYLARGTGRHSAAV